MFYKGLCIIPEGSRIKSVKDDTKDVIYNVSNIKNLDKYLAYAKTCNLGILYLSTKHGVVYADDIVMPSPVYLYKFSTDNLKIWSGVISEQLYRECINHGVSIIHLMIKNRNLYKQLINNLILRGVRVELPLLSNNRGNILWQAIKNR